MRLLVWLLLPALLIGCLPVELSTTKDGVFVIPRQEGFFLFDPADDQVQQVAGTEAGKPALALFSPDERQVLMVSAGSGALMGTQYNLNRLTLEDGSVRPVASGPNMGYVQWGPAGKRISYTRAADSAHEPLKENMPELHLVDLATGADRVVAHNLGSQHRWFPDGERLLVFRALSKEGDQYVGQLATLDADSGEEQVLAIARGSGAVMDVAPDGKRILFTANAAVKPGEELEGTSREIGLYGLDLTDSSLKRLIPGAQFGFFSPDGQRILCGREADDQLVLEVADAQGEGRQVLAKDGVKEAGPVMQSVPVYPGWVDAERVYYLAQRAVYGAVAKNLALTVVRLDDGAKRNLQPVIDAAMSAATLAQ